MIKRGDKFVLSHKKKLSTKNYDYLKKDSIRFEVDGDKVIWISMKHQGYSYIFIPEEK